MQFSPYITHLRKWHPTIIIFLAVAFIFGAGIPTAFSQKIEAPGITSPAPGSTLSSTTVTFTGEHREQDLQHYLEIGTKKGGYDVFFTDLKKDPTVKVTKLPSKGKIYVRYWTRMFNDKEQEVWVYDDATYTMAVDQDKPTTNIPRIVSPKPGSKIKKTPVTFTGEHRKDDLQHYLEIGTKKGGYDVFFTDLKKDPTVKVTKLPSKGKIYVRYWTRMFNDKEQEVWVYDDATYTMAVDQDKPKTNIPQLLSPKPGLTLKTRTVTFEGEHDQGDIQHWLTVGTKRGGYDLANQSMGTNHEVQVTNLPYKDKIYVRYGTKIQKSGKEQWVYDDAQYIMAVPVACGSIKILDFRNRLIIIDGNQVDIYDRNGTRRGSIPTEGPPTVTTSDDRIIVTDGNNVDIYDRDGTRRGSIPTDGPPTVTTTRDRIIVIDGNQVDIYDREGTRRGSIPPTKAEPPTVTTTRDRIIVTDGNNVDIYDRNGTRRGSIPTEGPPTVTTSDDRIIITDGNNVDIYDRNGTRRGSIVTDGPPTVTTTDDRIIIIDGNQVDIYDREGARRGSITTDGPPTVTTSDDRIIITDGNKVDIYDRNGTRRGSIATDGPPTVTTTDDRIIIIDGNQVDIYDREGARRGSITTDGPPTVTTSGDRIIVTDGNNVDIYDRNGTRRGSITTDGPSTVTTSDDRIIVTFGNKIEIYTKNGHRLKTFTMSQCIAPLMRSHVHFEPGENRKIVWFPMAFAGSLLVEPERGVNAVVFNRNGLMVDGMGAGTTEVGELELKDPADFYAVTFSRLDEVLTRSQDVEVAINFKDPKSVFTEDGVAQDTVIYSPLKMFPGADDVVRLPVPSSHTMFSDYVHEEYGYSLEDGIGSLSWFIEEELPYAFCPPAGHAAADAPWGAIHNDNYCGISTFIHSMEMTYPGALLPNVTTNAVAWDEVGDNLDHSNFMGTRGGKLVDNCNANYGGATPATQNGKSYCAGEINETSPANLAAWAEDCNLKILIYDYLHWFGHWADVIAVGPWAADPQKANLILQDYDKSYVVTYTQGGLLSQDKVDFSIAPLNNTMRSNFDLSNPIAGDNFFVIDWILYTPGPAESVGFYVVCECDQTTGGLPTTTKSGKTLNR